MMMLIPGIFTYGTNTYRYSFRRYFGCMPSSLILLSSSSSDHNHLIYDLRFFGLLYPILIKWLTPSPIFRMNFIIRWFLKELHNETAFLLSSPSTKQFLQYMTFAYSLLFVGFRWPENHRFHWCSRLFFLSKQETRYSYKANSPIRIWRTVIS